MNPLDDLPLPPLREDLRLSEAAAGPNGEPGWMIQDIVVNRFYRVGWLEFECLLRWGRTPRQVADEIAEQTALKPVIEQVHAFRFFLEQHQLLRAGPEAIERLRMRSEGSQWLTWNWWLHHYLFFRIPLVRPQRFMQWLAARLDWLFSPLIGVLIVLLSLLGIIMVAHQWDTFRSAVLDSFSAEGLLGFALALIVGKTLHELGHALTATRYGLRVSHMGIAFVVMWPMLYTDTGEAWKLRSSRQRLAIASAGIITEMSLAGLSTLGWALADPGTLRDALLYLATTGWVLTLALNISPFTRFDGYFILSDLLDTPNLHERSSALARVTLRRNLLGLDEEWPEPLSPHRRHMLVGFAFASWIYRFALFLGIAIAVYLMFFKLLGIFLFIVEVSWFLAMPIMRELRHWWAVRHDIPGRRRRVFFGGVIVLLLLLAIPWQTQISAFGVARAEHQLRVFSPFPARLRSVHALGEVKVGDALIVLEQPDIALRMHSSEANVRSYETQLSGLMATPSGLDQQIATRERLGVQFEQARSARSEMARLTIKAPFAGQWLDTDPQWQSGQWINGHESLGILVAGNDWQVDAYVKQQDVHRISVGAGVKFYAEGIPTPLHGEVVAIGSTRASELDQPMLAARYGGPISTSKQTQDLVPTSAVFHVLVRLNEAPASLRETRGHLQVDGNRSSPLAGLLKRIFAGLLKQSGF